MFWRTGGARSEAVACGSTGGGVLGMLAEVKDLVRPLRRIAITVVGTVILAVGVVLLVAPRALKAAASGMPRRPKRAKTLNRFGR